MSRFAIVDGNNFYVSCERVFRPSLNGRPVIVLSNNDGCAIARSNEAKALGIKMGAPWHLIRHLEESSGLVALSANFPLYGDMSDRMMTLAAGLGPEQEIYSIDESFINLAGVRGDLVERARKVRERIAQWVGIPCGVGIGSTKTLAKLANHVAKTAERKPGSYASKYAQVCDIAAMSDAEREEVFVATPLREVWGIGPRIGAQLEGEGLKTVMDVVRLDLTVARARWSVVLERTVRELQGVECIDFEDHPSAKQQIACTRSFGTSVTDLPSLQQAVSEFASRAAEKLRRQQSLAGKLLVFVHTSPFRAGPQYSRSTVRPLRRPTADTALLVEAAVGGMAAIYKSGFKMSKAGVMLLELQPETVQQQELDFGEAASLRDRGRLMRSVDELNLRFGRKTMSMAATGLAKKHQDWSMRQERRTPRYTTSWDEMPVARA